MCCYYLLRGNQGYHNSSYRLILVSINTNDNQHVLKLALLSQGSSYSKCIPSWHQQGFSSLTWYSEILPMCVLATDSPHSKGCFQRLTSCIINYVLFRIIQKLEVSGTLSWSQISYTTDGAGCTVLVMSSYTLQVSVEDIHVRLEDQVISIVGLSAQFNLTFYIHE